MILYIKGDLFQSPAQVLVNPVNTVGVMGKGLALDFKHLLPEMYRQYRILCERKQFFIGQLWLYKSPQKWVLNFPTKKHWRLPSRVEYIEAGLRKFVQVYSKWGIRSIAFPPLGCGNGQLDFRTQVMPLMEEYLRPLPIDIFIYIYSKKKNSSKQQIDTNAMKAWLQSKPVKIPFSNVWHDLVTLLQAKREFETITHGNVFTALVTDDPPGLQIRAPGGDYHVHYEVLRSFGQQLQTLGVFMHNMPSEVNQKMFYYIAPIFAELPYIIPAPIAEKYDHLEKDTATGLQILPIALSRQQNPTQFSLFPLE